MDKYAFLTEHEYVYENLGISDECNREMIKHCRVALIESDDNCCAAMEIVMNKTKPKNMVEALYLGFVLRNVIEVESPIKKMAAIFAMIAKDSEGE